MFAVRKNIQIAQRFGLNCRFMSTVPSWATVNPFESEMGKAQNCVNGKYSQNRIHKHIFNHNNITINENGKISLKL